MSKSPWRNIGDWAAESERAEAEEREAAEKEAAAQPPPSFPSLKEAVSTTAKQKKKTKMTLQEFNMQQSPHFGSDASRGLTPEEMLRLPTGPKERSPEEMQQGRLGGGFSNYGTRAGSFGSNQGRAREYEGRRSYGFPDDDRRGGSPQTRVSEMDQPSRADGVDNWASMKKQTVPEYNSIQARPGGRYSSLGGGGGTGGVSRADEVDNWASVKKPISQPQQQTRFSSFGSGFSRPEPDRWTRNEQSIAQDPPKLEVEVVANVNKPSPFGTARPREEVLAEKGLDWKKLDLDIEAKKQQHLISGGSRPASSQSSRPESPLSSKSEVTAAVAPGVDAGVVKQKPKVSPFGDAKPREVLLEEKGLDWKKIDLELEHRRVERPPSRPGMYEEARAGYPERPHSRPGMYEGPRGGSVERPPSRGGAYEDPRAAFAERPPSRPGAYEETRAGSRERPLSRPGPYEEPRGGFAQRSSFPSEAYQEPRAVDYNERPRSRGTVNSWTRPSDDRRASLGGGGRGFLGSRDVGRSASRW
ncbi:hypothetical protein CDL12_04342 [Handroanthus impetiginosus]|uniref:Uncharacterized protein n=1 Tax=Handroanthus impetiginosus TaxID=429701 RepID=A0A2G9HZL7_9LAMI|nr:hypothetical protein CDL12_04342 [Handroanthus impetiginosus]